jgi:hypothetical protein
METVTPTPANKQHEADAPRLFRPTTRSSRLDRTDAEQVSQGAVPNDPNNPTARFGRNSSEHIYRYSLGNNGTAPFSGIGGVGDGVYNLTQYAIDRLNGL